jgi:hypothetical protein
MLSNKNTKMANTPVSPRPKVPSGIWSKRSKRASDSRRDLSGGSLDFDPMPGLKINHQKISRLSCRFGLNERLGRFHVFDRADPTYAALYLYAENVERLCQEEWPSKQLKQCL